MGSCLFIIVQRFSWFRCFGHNDIPALFFDDFGLQYNSFTFLKPGSSICLDILDVVQMPYSWSRLAFNLLKLLTNSQIWTRFIVLSFKFVAVINQIFFAFLHLLAKGLHLHSISKLILLVFSSLGRRYTHSKGYRHQLLRGLPVAQRIDDIRMLIGITVLLVNVIFINHVLKYLCWIPAHIIISRYIR